MAEQQIKVPDIGGAEGAEVIELLVAEGDAVVVDQGLIVLESDKASMEIPSTVAGTVLQLLVAEGAQLAEGAPIAVIEVDDAEADDGDGTTAGDDTAAVAAAEPDTATQPDKSVDADEAEPATAEAPDAAPVDVTAQAAPAATAEAKDIYAGPAVRKLARELGVSLALVAASGPRGRIVKEDVQQYVKNALRGEKTVVSGAGGGAAIPEVPEVDFSRFGEVEITQRSKLDKLTAANMQRSWLNVPHVTQFDEADITELEAFRTQMKSEAQARDLKLTPLPFLLKACAVALRDNPKLASSLAQGGEQLVFKNYLHIGMAVDTPAGLVVPVIRDVDKKSIWTLAEEVLTLAEKARERKLMPAEMQGGCFTISSLGNIGGNGFTPIVNAPEVAILGVSRAAMKPVWDGQAFAPRKLLPLALSYDHRVVNGGDGGRFLSRLVALLGDIRQLLM